ncbi:MAG: ABC transporter substrate-binding protein, partial [Myxococcota bacterium]
MGLSERLWSVVGTCAVTVGLSVGVACTGSPDTAVADKAEPAPAPASDTILIGEYGSLTGSEATFGQSTHNGVLLAIDEINAAGGINGKKLAVQVYDDQGKTQEAGTAVTRLITDDKVVAVIGEVASSLSLAGGRVAQQYGVPMISPSSTNAKVTEIGDMVFRVCFIDAFQGYVGAKFAVEQLKVKNVAILYDQGSAYSKGLKDDFGKALTTMGGTVVTEQAYSSGDQDFSAQLGSIRDAKADAIYVPGYYTDVGNIAIQAKNLGVKATLIGGDGWDSSKLAEIGGDAIEGQYYSNHYAPEEQRPEVQTFVSTYQTKFGAVPDGLAALGYDATKVLAEAMKRAPSLGGADLAKAIAETKDFKGVTGNITIDANRNAQKPAVVVQLKGGKPTFVASILPPDMAAPAAAPTEPAPAEGAPTEPAPAPA